LKEWTSDSQNTPSTTNLEEEGIVDAPGNDGNASMPEKIKRPNPWRKMMMLLPVQSDITVYLTPQLYIMTLCSTTV
jgi:hypothetical protein